MKSQLIVTILGADRSGILSEVATTVSDANCNILDSRQAIYGQDFSLTMIIEGTQPAITRAECLIPNLCQKHDLLSMMKRTSEHEKQNLEQLFDVEFSGEDAAGLLTKVTGFFAKRDASISALRQKTFTDKRSGNEHMRCKLVVSVPKTADLEELEQSLCGLFDELKLNGQFKDTHSREPDENDSTWQ